MKTDIIEKYVKQATEVTPMPTFNITPHVFRHTKAMHLLNADVNMFYIRDILGHVNISTTEIYARVDAEKKRAILEKISCDSVPGSMPSWQEDRSLMAWLKGLAYIDKFFHKLRQYYFGKKNSIILFLE